MTLIVVIISENISVPRKRASESACVKNLCNTNFQMIQKSETIIYLMLHQIIARKD